MAPYTPTAPFRLRECLALFDVGALTDDGGWHDIRWETTPQLRLMLAGPFVSPDLGDLEDASSELAAKAMYLRGNIGRKYYDEFVAACGGEPEKPTTVTGLMGCFKCFDLVEYSHDFQGVKRVIQRAIPTRYRFDKDSTIDAEYQVFDGPWHDILWNRNHMDKKPIDAHWSPVANLETAFGLSSWEEFQVLPEPADDFCSPLYRVVTEDGCGTVGMLIFQNMLGSGAFDPMPLFLRPIIYPFLDEDDERICVLHETFVDDVNCIGAVEVIELA